MAGMNVKLSGFERRKARVRKKVEGTTERPRLNVHRTNKHIYAQVIDDSTGKTLVASSTIAKGFSDSEAKKIESAKAVGQTVAKLAKEKGITKVVFDRGGYIYHGRIKALADGAREAGLEF